MRIVIDPNVRTVGNESYAGFGDLFGDVAVLHVGDRITAMGAETAVVFPAYVSRIDHDSKLIYLAVLWAEGRVDTA